jgi:diadenosine tetraphosphate (Ap4A) HIT family hydrolase
LKTAPTKNAKRHGLSEIIRGFKTFSARRINQLRGSTGSPSGSAVITNTSFETRTIYTNTANTFWRIPPNGRWMNITGRLAMPDRTTTPETCLVCQKHRGEKPVPGGVIYEDELVYVSHSFIPEGKEKVYLGTLFVEPKRHAAAFEDLTDEEAQAVGLWVTRTARALKAATNAEHIYLFRFGHHVNHLHVWLVPRYAGTPEEFWGLKADEWPGAPHGGEAEIAELCDQIRSALKVEVE